MDQGLGMACGVVFRVPETYCRRLQACGVDLTRRAEPDDILGVLAAL